MFSGRSHLVSPVTSLACFVDDVVFRFCGFVPVSCNELTKCFGLVTNLCFRCGFSDALGFFGFFALDGWMILDLMFETAQPYNYCKYVVESTRRSYQNTRNTAFSNSFLKFLN